MPARATIGPARIALAVLACLSSACTEPAGPRERGDRILFVRSADATSTSENSGDIWRMTPDGTDLQNLTQHPAAYTDLQYTGDGVVIFAAGRSYPGASAADCGRRIWRMATDGSQLRPVTTGPECSFHPRLSPSGTRIAYVRGSSVYASNLDGSGEALLTGALPPVPAGPCGAAPKVTVMVAGWYAPDRVSFWRHVCLVGTTHYTVRPDGGDLQEVPSSEPSSMYVSPDHSRAAYVRDGQVWIRNLDGTGARALARIGPLPLGGSPLTPSPWSPDGTRLVFRDSAQRYLAIRTDGSGLHHFTTPPGTQFGGWSGDGARIAWTVYQTARFDIHVSAADGSAMAPLATGGTSNRYAVWVETP